MSLTRQVSGVFSGQESIFPGMTQVRGGTGPRRNIQRSHRVLQLLRFEEVHLSGVLIKNGSFQVTGMIKLTLNSIVYQSP